MLSEQHPQQKQAQTGRNPGVSWCKHVLERIKIEEEEKENKEEATSFCWRGFLFRNINAAKNKPTAGPDVFHLSRKKGNRRPRTETMSDPVLDDPEIYRDSR